MSGGRRASRADQVEVRDLLLEAGNATLDGKEAVVRRDELDVDRVDDVLSPWRGADDGAAGTDERKQRLL